MVSNDYYELKNDKTNNRVQFSVKGFWRSPDVVPDYLVDWEKTLAEVKPGFTVLANATGMKTPPVEVGAIHRQVQEMCLANGLSKIGEVVNTAITKPSMGRIYKKQGLVAIKKQFHDIHRAITWLDSKKE